MQYSMEWMWGLGILGFLLALRMLRYQVLLALIAKAALRLRARERPLKDTPNFVILVPAHNEEVGIAATIGSLHALDYPRAAFRVIVIADNCTDLTAKTARVCGAEVLVRFDEKKKSKGYALEFALEALGREKTPPDAIVVIDADTRVDRRLLQGFAMRLHDGDDFLQAYYSVSNPDDSWRTQLMTYAFGLFNGIWLAGEDALGLGCSLRGNGMCFSWKGLARRPWRAYGLAEDLEFSWYLRTVGEKIHFVPESRVYGEIISGNAKASKAQRLRWEKGRSELKATFARTIEAVELPSFKKWLLKSDLHMPPLSRWVILSLLGAFANVSALVLALGLKDMAGLVLGTLLLLYYLLVFLSLGLYLSLPFTRLALPWRYLSALLRAPLYIVWKFKILLSRTPVQWVRTERMAERKRD